MAIQAFLARVAGVTKHIFAIDSSAGAADAGKIAALNSAGVWDLSFMPPGIGPTTTAAVTTDTLSAGNFVNFYNNGGTFNMRLADNSNGRPANGYVIAAFSASATATAYPLDGTNANMTGLTEGAAYWLDTAGGVTATPLDETDVANANKISQYLGIAKSTTELVTDDHGYVVL